MHMTASERLIKLLAVYMLNKVLLPCGKFKNKLRGRMVESDEEQKTWVQTQTAFYPLHT